jgi:hypothetical protein
VAGDHTIFCGTAYKDLKISINDSTIVSTNARQIDPTEDSTKNAIRFDTTNAKVYIGNSLIYGL